MVGSDALLRFKRCGLERRRSRRDGASAKGGVGERRDVLPLFSEDSSEDGAVVTALTVVAAAAVEVSPVAAADGAVHQWKCFQTVAYSE
eukprot:CAMPEP_0201912988 /NCGR_PEP_ID=MMETSP0903-20130614/3521_1 /ASSEMBLY_ACC=CAM_ASM_000552 /TAXON_ID=420261 /ORGANISM="Thalassiosira antarctica, Strain CCMP982" /LENGTH=88 /DNA_ID=CAMNT_0048448073 /DNA_START=32 /DNA_END=296 /DNA_ORIENTATION=-